MSNLVRDIIIDIVFNDRNLVVMIDLLIRALSMRLIIVDDMLFNYRFRGCMLYFFEMWLVIIMNHMLMLDLV